MIQGTAHVQCSCEHSFQDKKYGAHVRVANATQKNAGTGKVEVRCTVCSKTHQINQSQLK